MTTNKVAIRVVAPTTAASHSTVVQPSMMEGRHLVSTRTRQVTIPSHSGEEQRSMIMVSNLFCFIEFISIIGNDANN